MKEQIDQIVNCGGEKHFYSLRYFPQIDETMWDNSERAKTKVAAKVAESI